MRATLNPPVGRTEKRRERAMTAVVLPRTFSSSIEVIAR
jgi:hypothetical protein